MHMAGGWWSERFHRTTNLPSLTDVLGDGTKKPEMNSTTDGFRSMLNQIKEVAGNGSNPAR